MKNVTVNMGKIFVKNSSFHAKQPTTGDFKFLFLISFVLALTKFSFWEEDLAAVYNYISFCLYSEFSQFYKILSLNSFGNTFGNSYNQFITSNQASFHFW